MEEDTVESLRFGKDGSAWEEEEVEKEEKKSMKPKKRAYAQFRQKNL
jgi:hypothetical protein